MVLNLGRGWLYCLPRSTTRHTRPFSVARRDRQVHCVSRGYCGRQDARAGSLHTGLQPFTCDEVVAVTRCARAAEAAHIVFRFLSQNSISVLKPMGAASTAHLLLCHSAVVTLARLSDPHRELPAGGGSQSCQRPAGPVNGRTWLVLDHDVSRGDSTRRAPLTAASSALCA